MAYSIDPIQNNCCPGTTVLVIATIQAAQVVTDLLRQVLGEAIE